MLMAVVAARSAGAPATASAEQVLDALPLGVLAADPAGIVSLSNFAAREALGRSADWLVGRHLGEVIDHPAVARIVAGLVRGGERRLMATVPRPDGRRLPIGLTLARSTVDSKVAVTAHFRDLGESSALDTELRRSDRSAALRELSAGLAHELRNPLAAIQALTESLPAVADSSLPLADYTRRILAQVHRADRLIQGLLDFGRPSAPSPAVVRPEALVAKAVAAMPVETTVRCQIEGGLPPVLVDAQQIVACLEELLANAYQATADADRIQLELGSVPGSGGGSARGRRVRISVCDRGPGIRPEHLQRIFDPFFSTRPGSAGLGLAKVEVLVQENGGTLGVRSEPGKGSAFTIELPEAPP